MANATFYGIQKTIGQAIRIAFDSSSRELIQQIKQRGSCVLVIDGAWPTRGHHSLDEVVRCIDFHSRKIMYVITLQKARYRKTKADGKEGEEKKDVKWFDGNFPDTMSSG